MINFENIIYLGLFVIILLWLYCSFTSVTNKTEVSTPSQSPLPVVVTIRTVKTDGHSGVPPLTAPPLHSPPPRTAVCSSASIKRGSRYVAISFYFWAATVLLVGSTLHKNSPNFFSLRSRPFARQDLGLDCQVAGVILRVRFNAWYILASSVK